jgi:gliding motility-associated-like protein
LTKSQTVYIYASTAGGCLDQESFVVTINQSPTANNQSLVVCSDQQLKLKLPGSSNESPILSYNITNINSNGLISSLGSPNLGNGFKDDEIFNDAWSNQGVEAKDIVYTIKPVGNGNCSNNSFTATITVNPEPVVMVQTLSAVCSDASAEVPFGSSISGSVAAATYNVTALNSGGLSFSGGGAADGTGLSVTALEDDAFSNLTANKVNVNYTVVPVSSNSCQGDPFTVTLPVNPEPVVSNQTISGVCSDIALGVPFNSSTGVAADKYNVTKLDLGLLTVSAGRASIDNGLTENSLLDDAFRNESNSLANVVYTVVPFSPIGCQGNSFSVSVSVNPEPVVENQTKTVCSDVATAVNLNGSTNGISIGSYSITNLNSNGMLSSAGAPSTGPGLPSTVISNHAWTNTTSSSNNVVYTVVPIAQSTTCSGNAFTATISVNPEPVVSNQNLLAVCSDASAGVPFGSSISGSIAAATYNVTALNSGGLSFSGGGAAEGTGLSAAALEDDAFSNLTANQVNVVYQLVPVSSNSCQGDPFTVNLPVNPEPVIDNQIISLCSFSPVGIPFSASKSVPSINYNVVGLNLNGLKVLSGNPSIATDLKMLDLADDAFENTSISVLNVVYNVVPVSEKGCRGDSKTTTISVSPAIYLDTTKLTKFYEYCSGDQVNIQFTGTVNKYSWTSSNSKTGISSGSGQGLNYKTTNTSDKNQLTTIRVSANLGNCVGKNFDFNITVKPIPNVVINPRRKMTYCSGDSSDYIDFRGLYSDSTLFIWRQTNTSIWNEKLPISDTGDISKHLLQNIQMSNPLTSQVDSIFVLPKLNGCIGIEDTLIISVKPETSIRVNDFKVCSNEKVAETCFSSLVSGVDFDWRFGNLGIGMPSFSGKGCIPSWISSNSGKANVVVTPIIQNCRGKSDTLTIDVLPLPKINPVTDYAFCHDESTGDIKFNSNIESKIFWRNIGPSIGSLSSGINYIPSFIASNELTIPIEGIFEIYGSNTTSGITCTGDTTELLIIVNPLPKVNAGNDTLLCKTQCLKLNATGESINPPLIFSWDKSGIQGKPFCVNNSIMLTVTGTDQNLCKNSDEIEINYIDINPPLVNAGPDDAICRGESYTLNAIVGLDVVFSWNNGVINSTPFKPELSKEYILKAIDPKTGCINRDTVEIVVNLLPNVKIATPDAIVCEGETVTLTASGALNFEWKNGNKDSVYTMSPAVGGTYEVIGTDVNGCSNSADTLVVVNPLPIPMFSSNMKNGGCLPFCPKLYDETGKNQNGPIGSTIAWNFGNNTTSNQLDSTVVCFDDYGCYDVTLIATTSEGCSASLTQKDFFCVKDIIADFATDPASATQSVYSPLFNFTNKTSNASTYKWYFGDNGYSSPQSIISDPSYTYSFGGFFMVRLVASTDDGCSDTIQKQITVLDDLIMNIPNAFTPNGDDLNDEFIPILTSGFDRNSGYLLNIYNRWGEIIYTSEQFGEGWDGTIENQPAPIGTYNWVLKLKDSMSNKILTFNGYVSLIR